MGARHSNPLRCRRTAAIHRVQFHCINTELYKHSVVRTLWPGPWSCGRRSFFFFFWSLTPLTLWHINARARIADLRVLSGCRVFLSHLYNPNSYTGQPSAALPVCGQSTPMHAHKYTRVQAQTRPSGRTPPRRCASSREPGFLLGLRDDPSAVDEDFLSNRGFRVNKTDRHKCVPGRSGLFSSSFFLFLMFRGFFVFF